MGNGFLDRVEDNAAVRAWSEKIQREKGDSLAVGHVSELWDFTRVSVAQNNLQELKEIWDQWDNEVRHLFYLNYGDLPYLLDMKVDKRLFRALAQFWNPAYSCFTFGKVDLVPTIEEYTALLRCSKVQVDKIYSKVVNVPTFLKKLINITGISEQWVTARIKQKGDSRCILWKSLNDLILAHPDARKKVDVFALSIYGLIVFPKVLGHIDETVTDLFDRLDKGVTPVPVILAETFRSLNACRRTGEGRFIGCAQLLLEWFYSHFWKVDRVSYQVFFESYSPLKEIVATSRRDDITEEKWMAIFQNLRRTSSGELRGCFQMISYIGVGILTGSRQFVPATQGLAECEFSYKDDGYKRKAREMANAWNQTRRMKRLAVGPMTTPEYNEWRVRRINDNIPGPSSENSQSIEGIYASSLLSWKS
ncbi:uncharacterized protein [Gossypium hirsutum]|uniref:DUF7745 domain-containing protein n=1 Tax=Gossypium hirsutum TaxID=3635 RepID=A0A1U8MRT2_GOSHI|nr:uncharacterized protein LOC107940631 [Gossypium hirsutum]